MYFQIYIFQHHFIYFEAQNKSLHMQPYDTSYHSKHRIFIHTFET